MWRKIKDIQILCPGNPVYVFSQDKWNSISCVNQDFSSFAFFLSAGHVEDKEQGAAAFCNTEPKFRVRDQQTASVREPICRTENIQFDITDGWHASVVQVLVVCESLL